MLSERRIETMASRSKSYERQPETVRQTRYIQTVAKTLVEQ